MTWITSKLLERFAQEDTDAHRLFSSPDLWVERFGADLLISHKSLEVAPEFLESASEWAAEAGLTVERIFGKHLPRQNADRVAPKLLLGDPALPPERVVRESGLKYGVNFEAGYSCGLFIDQRNNRKFLRHLEPKKLLNCFAYTCAFSVAAAKTGAATISLDLSRKSLDRGKANFALNGLAPEGHRFLADDVLEVLPRFERRSEKFDAIVLDPPTFSRGSKGRRWQVEQDLGTLISQAFELAGNRCAMLVSTNCTRLTRRELELVVRPIAKAQRFRCEYHVEAPPPDFPEYALPKALWLELSKS